MEVQNSQLPINYLNNVKNLSTDKVADHSINLDVPSNAQTNAHPSHALPLNTSSARLANNIVLITNQAMPEDTGKMQEIETMRERVQEIKEKMDENRKIIMKGYESRIDTYKKKIDDIKGFHDVTIFMIDHRISQSSDTSEIQELNSEKSIKYQKLLQGIRDIEEDIAHYTRIEDAYYEKQANHTS